MFTNSHLDDGNKAKKEPTKGEVLEGDAMVGATEVKQIAQRAKASTLMKKLKNEPITIEEKQIVDD